MALKSTEVLNGNFSASRRFSSSHNGIDLRSPNGTLVKSRYAGEVTVKGTNPPGEDFGNYIRILNNNSNVESWYAHLQGFRVKTRQLVKKGEIIGWSGNTGLSTGPHLHYSESTGNLRWLDPDKVNVKEVEEVTEVESKVASFIYLYRAINNKFPSTRDKKYFLGLAKKGIDPAAWSRNQYFTPRINKLKTQITTLTKRVKGLQTDLKDFNKLNLDLTKRIVVLEDELRKRRPKPSQKPVEVESWWDKLINLFRG